MTSYEKYTEYTALCAAHGMRPLSYVAWSSMFPLSETSF